MLYENLDDGVWIIDVVIWVELQFLKLRILTHQILYWIFEAVHDLTKFVFSRRGLDIEDDFVIDSQFLGDRQGIR